MSNFTNNPVSCGARFHRLLFATLLCLLTPLAQGQTLSPKVFPVSESVLVGDPVSFTAFPWNGLATAPPGEPTFQWQLNGVDLPGETGLALISPGVQLSDSGTYTVVVSYAGNSFVSSPATLTVHPADYVYPGDPLANWTVQTSGTGAALRSVTYGAGLFGAVGDAGTILTSTDGATWTARDSGTSAPLYGIAYGAGTWIAVGDAGAILTSSNAVSWTGRTETTSAPLRGVAFGNGAFVAVGDGGTIQTFIDGVGWIAITSPMPTALNHVTYANGLFVAVGAGGTIVTSPDGLGWNRRNSSTTLDMFGITYGAGEFVMTGLSGAILTSTNGLSNWVGHSGPSHNLFDVTFANGAFVAVCDAGAYYTSTDGINWQSRNPRTQADLHGVAFGAGTFVAVGDAGAILQSQTYPFVAPSIAFTRSANRVVLSWPVNFTLQSSPDLSAANNWIDVTSSPTINNNQNTLPIDASSGSQFFRLIAR